MGQDTGQQFLRLEQRGSAALIKLAGEWSIREAHRIEPAIAPIVRQISAREAVIDADAIEQLDTAGGWLILRMYRDLRARGIAVELKNIAPAQEMILQTLGDSLEPIVPKPERESAWRALITRVGEAVVDAFEEGGRLISFIGEIAAGFGRCIRSPSRFRLISLMHHIDRSGVSAMAIVGLISFLISIVLAYQGATQLRQFGAEIFTIDLVAVSVLREMGGLLAAIMIAGRSGSAFTAEIGTMQVNEEIDAMKTLGLNPVEILVLPRVAALMIVLPLLTFFADIMGLLGGALISLQLLDVSLTQYLGRLREAIGPWTFWIGIIKAPFFAFLIATVGCLRGLQVSGSAESVGRLTTVSVVESIFLVMIADALFSILFSNLGI